jgi:chitin synthase
LLNRFSVHWKYKLITFLLAILMVYVMFAAVMCIIQAARTGGTQYHVMLFSVVMTYGSTSSYPLVGFGFHVTAAYFFSSVLAMDPYHMITSFPQYMLLSPMYINILNM